MELNTQIQAQVWDYIIMIFQMILPPGYQIHRQIFQILKIGSHKPIPWVLMVLIL